MTYERWRTTLVILLVVIAGLYLVTLLYHTALTFANIIFLYFTAWLIRFLISPVVDWLVGHRFPRLLAVIYVYLLLAAIVVILLLSAVPTILTEAEAFTRQVPGYGRTIVVWVQQLQDFLVQNTPIKRANIVAFVNQYANQLNAEVKRLDTNLVSISGLVAGTTVNTVTGALNIVQSSVNWLLNFVIILVLSFYMTLDGRRLATQLTDLLPEFVAVEVRQANMSIERMFGGYIRGQLILSTIYAVLTYITLLWFHVGFQIVLAVFAGAMMLIPFIGSFLAVIPPVIIAAVQLRTPGDVIKLLIILFLWQQLTLNILAPRVLGDSIGMHPLLIFLGVLLGTKLAGPWGAIFGVPVLGVMLELAKQIYQRFAGDRWKMRTKPSSTAPPKVRRSGSGLPLAAVLSQSGEHVPGLDRLRRRQPTSPPDDAAAVTRQDPMTQRSSSSVSSTTSTTPGTREATSAARSPSSRVSTSPRK